ncbi:Flagellar biosynthesis protein FlhB [Paramagnetospirillum magnetotacticum MS-1]|uniref:Flagellar biosynthetic protein FlhB n=1 Tax=Paramagnetospirillum magnetotacticum MS-1 TaxID=272627 RepID=A0A0C2YQB7_PARME|nr:flagellar biosynthesis protein FlhB [Paramagnetospirillum magnetotacticum]KIL97308.1 Flagellar biosynthesis protein FlhB [Paramagnetospirillum magnetotacticum MS-1]
MAEDSDDKTEEPTDRKLSQAREQGNIPTSQEVKMWASLVGALVIITLFAPYMARDMGRLLLPFIEHPHAFPMEQSDVGNLLSMITMDMLKILVLPMMMLVVLALVSAMGQSGLMFLPDKLTMDFSKLSPMKGITRIFSGRNLVEFAKSLFKVSAIGFVIFLVLKSHMSEYAGLAALDLMAVLDYMRHQVIAMIMIVVLMVFVLAAADWFYQRWAFNQQMKMTKQEIKDEHKQTEGDPMIKGRLRALRMQRARQRMMAAVPKASVVVTNPTHYAVALQYDQDSMGAPVLVAKGVDLIAKRIRDLATENEVPIVENPPLARALYATVELDEEIPPEHYKTVAEIIGYVMKLKGELAH